MSPRANILITERNFTYPYFTDRNAKASVLEKGESTMDALMIISRGSMLKDGTNDHDGTITRTFVIKQL